VKKSGQSNEKGGFPMPKRETLPVLEKVPTGISGLDEVTSGGLPGGRPTLVCGGTGCGKTLLGMEFLVRGITRFGEPGVFMSFEETAEDLAKNVSSLGFDLNRLIRARKLAIDYVHIDRSEIEKTGEYDLEGLFIRLGHAVDSVRAKRVVLDTVESLFSGLPDQMILRAELRRLFRWLKTRGLTAVITAERGDSALTRHGLEEYISDCVIFLDHRVTEQVSTRRLRIVKYRGSVHGTNEYPFLIDERGLSVLPITSLGLKHSVTSERISSGIPRLDGMLGGKGYFRGSSILISGTAGTGKTSVAAEFVAAACGRREKAIFFSFEESPGQVTRNMRSIGIDLQPWIDKGQMLFHAERPTLFGLEAHLVDMHKLIDSFHPRVVVVDPVSNLNTVAFEGDVRLMLTRLIDYMKLAQITTLFTSLTPPGISLESTAVGISSLADTWILLRDIELGGERNRGMYVLKSRGMAHSNQIREFLLTDHGIDLVDVYVGPSGVLTGASRVSQEAKEKGEELARRQESERRIRQSEGRQIALEAQIVALRSELEAEKAGRKAFLKEEKLRHSMFAGDREAMSRQRKADRIPERSPR
jgi:circadian clock protein KaiC